MVDRGGPGDDVHRLRLPPPSRSELLRLREDQALEAAVFACTSPTAASEATPVSFFGNEVSFAAQGRGFFAGQLSAAVAAGLDDRGPGGSAAAAAPSAGGGGGTPLGTSRTAQPRVNRGGSGANSRRPMRHGDALAGSLPGAGSGSPRRGGSQDGGHSDDGQAGPSTRRMQSKAAPRSPKASVLRWAVPALALLAGLFIQTIGLYLSTCCYVRWMDEMRKPLPVEEAPGGRTAGHAHPAPGSDVVWAIAGAALEDVAGAVPQPLHPVALRAADAVEALAMWLPVAWLAWVARTRDIRTWTHVLLCAALLASLKGFLAWATVLPDAEGWAACQARLTEDGLQYYRRRAGLFLTDSLEVEVAEAFLDVVLLVVRSIWLFGREQRDNFCAGSTLCSSTCLRTLLSASLYQAVRTLAPQLEEAQQIVARVVAKCFLGLLLLGTMVFPILCRQQYAADVILAIVVTPLVYSSPALAVAAERWAGVPPVAAAKAGAPTSPKGAAPSLLSPWGSSTDAGSMVGLLSASVAGAGAGVPHPPRPEREVGILPLPPCGLPFCSLEGIYYLRAQPLPEQTRVQEGGLELWARQKQLFQSAAEKQRDRIRRAEDQLRKAQLAGREQSEQRRAERQAHHEAAEKELLRRHAEEEARLFGSKVS